MMTVRFSDEEQTAWLDCEFCGKTNEYALASHVAETEDGSTTHPDAEFLLVAHFSLNAKESYGFAPCTKPPGGGHTTTWEARSVDSGRVLSRGTLEFPAHGTVPKPTRT